MDAESRSEKLKKEIQSLEFQRKNAFQSPAKEWIEHRLDNLRETLEKDTKQSALAFKELLGTIEMENLSFSLNSSCLIW